MKPVVTIIEDKIELALEFEQLLGFGQDVIIEKIVFTTKSGPIQLRLEDHKERKRGFLVDLNLNPYQKEERGGLVLIKQIKKRYPNSFIIAYSSYGDKNESLDAGADFFFLKRSKYNDRDFVIFKQFFLNHFNDGDIKSILSAPINTKEIENSIQLIQSERSEEIKEIVEDIEFKIKECKYLRERRNSNLSRISEIEKLGSDKNGIRNNKIIFLKKEIETCDNNIEMMEEEVLKLHTVLKTLI